MTATAPGPLAEEAARLVEAIGEWARGAAGGLSMPTVGDGPECGVCPFCQLLALVRRTQPETFGHLADASASMVAALRTVVERHEHGGARTTGVERIDLDDREPAPEPPMTARATRSTQAAPSTQATPSTQAAPTARRSAAAKTAAPKARRRAAGGMP